jgi:sugar phosphate isomerase/epimerase
MNTTRRELLSAGASLAAMSAFGCAATKKETRAPFTISLAEWSFHRALQGGQMTHLDFPVVARRDFDIGACEYVNSFFKDKAHDDRYLEELARRCNENGVRSALIMCDGEGDLASEDTIARSAAVSNHKKWVDAAARLGCHSIRVNVYGTGSPQEHAKRAADSLVQLASYATPDKLNIIVENHGGITSDGAWMASVMKIANHPRVGTLPDFGNFNMGDGKQYDRYKGVEEMMPFAKAVSAKSYAFDERGEETTIDYHRMMRIVVDGGYHGNLGIEYEGDVHSEHDGVRLTQELLVRIRGELEKS